MIQSRLPAVVFGGVDGSGKTAAQKVFLREFSPYAEGVNEVAGPLIDLLKLPVPYVGDAQLAFQRVVWATQVHDNTRAENRARQLGKILTLRDRDNGDIDAYVPGGWDQAHKIGADEVVALESSDLLLYFEAPPRDVLERIRFNNPGRIYRTFEENMELDARTRRSWARHRRIVQIPNDGGWERKLDVARQELSRFIDELLASR